MTNMLKKVLNWSEVYLSKMTCYKIHTLKSCRKWMWHFFFLKKIIMNFKLAAETFSIVSCSTRDTSPRDLCIMTLAPTKQNTYNVTNGTMEALELNDQFLYIAIYSRLWNKRRPYIWLFWIFLGPMALIKGPTFIKFRIWIGKMVWFGLSNTSKVCNSIN